MEAFTTVIAGVSALVKTLRARNSRRAAQPAKLAFGPSLYQRVLVGRGIEYKRVFGRFVIRRPEAGEDFFGLGVWIPPALAGNLVARTNECAQWALAFLVGKVRLERRVCRIG
jgi:hypothetical protein